MNQITRPNPGDHWTIHNHFPLFFCMRYNGGAPKTIVATAARDIEGVLRIRPRAHTPLPPLPVNAHQVLDDCMKRRT